MASALEKLRKARQGSGTSLASANIGGGMAGSGASGGSALARLRAARSGRTQPTLTSAAQRYAANNTSSAALKNGPSGTPVTNGPSGTPVPTGGNSKNRGGLLGGIGYVGEKIGLGFMQGIEGVVDYVGAGIAELFGNDEASERIISNDWMNYSHADEWFNPGEGWRIAGDVGGGIGTSLPGLVAGAAVTWATGGSGIGAGIGLALSGFSAAGTSTKEAYLESGELGGKEFGYGAAMGVVEVATEKLSGSLGKGLLRGIDDIAGAFGKTASKTAKALTVKTVAKDLGGEFLSEAFEEGFAEFVSPYAKRLTYDPNAKNATIEEISYAALVGGLSGLAMGGGRVGVTQLGHNVQGNKAVDAGRVTSIMDTAKAFSDYEGEHPTKLSSLEAIRDLYTRLDAQGVRTATELTGNQRRALGELQALTTTAVFEPAMQKSALSAIAGADAIAEKLNADGNVKIVDGRMQVVTSDILAELQKKGAEVRDITAEDIRGGVDVKSGKSIREALKKKDVLRYVVASDVAGRFLMTAKEVETAARAGTKIKSQADLNAFIENASEEQKHALGAELGIADNEWATLKLKRFNEAAAAYRESGKLDAKRAEMQAQKEKASAVAQTPSDVAKTLKTAENAGLTNTDQGNVSVSGGISPSARMSMDEITDNPSVAGGDTLQSLSPADAVQLPLHKGAEKSEAKAKETSAVRVSELKERLDAKKIDSYAAENIEGYSSLGEANKSMIRQVVREGRANGLDDADVLTSARVAARTGLNIEYDTNTEDGVAGYYDPRANKIVVNPKAAKRQELILIHELDHALRAFRGNDGKVHYLVYKDADKKLSDETWSAIQKEYADQDIEVSREELLADEASAYYTEAILGGKGTVDLLLGKEPSLAKKILNFFTDAARAYSGDEKLSKEARRHYRNFKKMFDAFSEFNKGRNAETAGERETVGTGVPDGPSSVVDTTQEKSVRQSKNIDAKLFEVDEKELSKRTFSYKELVAKGDLTGYVIDKNVQVPLNSDGSINGKQIVEDVRKKCQTTNTNSSSTKYFVPTLDIGRNVEITSGGITHGFFDSTRKNKKPSPRDLLNAKVSIEIPKILQNSIEVNRSTRGGNSDVPFSRVMMGAVGVEDTSGNIEYYAVRSVVEERVNLDPVLVEAQILGKLYAVNAKKIDSPNPKVAKNSVARGYGDVYAYSIAQFLQDVKGVFDDTFSVDVYKQLGAVRKSNDFSKNLRFSKDITPKVAEESGTQKPLLGVFDKHGRNIEAVRSTAESRFRKEILNRFDYSNAGNVKTRDLINYHLGKNAEAMLKVEPIEIAAPTTVGERALKDAAGDLKIAGVYENADIGAVSIAPSRMKGYGTAKLSKGDAALLSSLGDILERGRVVAFSHPDGVLYEEIKIVAPLKIGKKTVYAEATVRRSDSGGSAYVYSVSASSDVKKALYDIRKPAQSKRLADKLDVSEGDAGAKSGGYVDPENAVQERKSEESASENAAQATGSEEATPSVSKDLLLMLRKNRGRVRITTKDYAALTEAVGARAARSIKNRWGYKAGTNVGDEGTVSIYRFVKEVKSSGEIDGLSGMSTLEAFAEINRVYKENSRTAGAFATNEEIERLKKLNKDLNDDNRATLISQVDYIVKKLGELKDATFFNASQYNTEELKSSVLSLVNVEWRGKNSATAVRRLAASFSAWYNKENPMLGYVSDENPGLYDAGIKETLESLKDSTGEQLTNDELRDLIEVLSFAKGFAERFSRVYRDGKWVDAKPEAEKSIAAAKKAKELNSGYTAVKHAMFEYAKALSDPLLVVQMADKYNPDGFFTKSYLSLEQGEVNARVTEMETLSEFDAFFEKNKGYANKLMNEDTEYRGHKMRRTQLIDLYMSLKSTTAMPGLAFSGFEFTNKQGYSERVDGFIVDQSWKHLLWSSSDADRAAAWDVLKRSSAYQRGEIKKLLTEQDLEYIAVMERGYLKTKELKASTDEIKFGFARTKEGYYLPTVRANVAKNVQNLYTQVDLVNNISANKRTKQGVTSELYIGDSSEKFKGHVRAISNYAGLSVEIDNYNKVFNLDISDNPNKPISVKTETVNAWRTLGIVGKNGAKMTKAHAGNAYISDIIDTITGVPQVKGALSSAVGIVRSRYAQATLGLNLKSWFSQMQSWISASSEYEIADMLKGASLAFSPGIYEQMDAYCPLAKLRNHDNSAAKAQGLIDNVKGIGELAMKPTSVIDRFVCALDFGAAQIEVERTTGAKVGTKENLEAAGKRLTEVILRTQQNTLATSKNAAARSGSELAKSVVMFKSDAIKTIGRGISTLGEYFTLRSELRSMKHSGASAEDIAAQEKRVRGAGRRAFKANLANVMGAFYAVAIGQLASLLFYGKKDEEDERPLLAVAGDFVGNILGGLPIIGDIYSRFADGYEIKDNGYALINDVLDSIDSAFSLAAKGAEGNLTSQDSAKALRNVTFAFSSLFGIPTKNIYKTGKGLLRIASPDTLYKMERAVEVKNLASDFEEAVEAGDDDKAMMILGLLLEERLGTDGERTVGDADNPSVAGGDTSLYTREALRMEKVGYNVLPRTIGSTVTIAGAEVDMTPEEQTALRARYSEATGHIEALVGSAEYAALSDEQKESAIRFIYDVYYDVGIAELYGYDRNLKRRLFSRVISVEKLALANAATAGLESDHEDGRGKAVSSEAWAKIRGTAARVNYSTVQGSKRKKVIAAINKLPLTTAEKLLIIAYKGYTVKDGDIRGVSAARAKQMLSRYARGQGLSKDEARALEEYL